MKRWPRVSALISQVQAPDCRTVSWKTTLWPRWARGYGRLRCSEVAWCRWLQDTQCPAEPATRRGRCRITRTTILSDARMAAVGGWGAAAGVHPRKCTAEAAARTRAAARRGRLCLRSPPLGTLNPCQIPGCRRSFTAKAWGWHLKGGSAPQEISHAAFEWGPTPAAPSLLTPFTVLVF